MKCEFRTDENKCLAGGGDCPAITRICPITRAVLSDDVPMVEGLLKTLKPKQTKRATETVRNLLLLPALKI